MTLPVREFPIVWQALLLDSPRPQDIVHPKTLFSLFVFILCPTSFQGDWFAFLYIWDHPPVIKTCSVGVASHTGDLLIYLRGRKWSPCPILLPSGMSLDVIVYGQCSFTFLRLPGEISITSDMQMTPHLWQKVKRN